MTSAIRLGIHSQAGYRFYVKLTHISIAKPYYNTHLFTIKIIINQSLKQAILVKA